MRNFISLGKKIYDVNKPREAHRMVVFVSRCCLHHRRMKEIDSFFRQNELLRKIADAYPFVYEQPTRAFFYHRSTIVERIELMKEHMTFMTEHFRPEVVLGFYNKEVQTLWEMDIDADKLSLALWFHPGQRKEGLGAVDLFLNGRELYQIMYWIARNRDGEWSLYIGAMQGPNMENARDIIKRVTKRCHAYRTKNLILYAVQCIARTLEIQHIYAVTNEGYYANNHIRMDRKLKTSFSDFWMEAGGWHTVDRRFDELPLTEKRKSMDKISTHKRALYRRRFELLDEVDAAVTERLKKLML